MMEKLFALSLGFAALVLAVGAAHAGGPCAPRDKVLATLADRWGETRQSVGLASGQAVMEVFASPDTGTWTITITLPDGTTCLAASGEGFEMVRAAAGDPA